MFRLNQKVWCLVNGEGVVRVSNNAEVIVDFCLLSNTYTPDGRLTNNSNVVLYPTPVTITQHIEQDTLVWIAYIDAYRYADSIAPNGDILVYLDGRTSKTAIRNSGEPDLAAYSDFIVIEW